VVSHDRLIVSWPLPADKESVCGVTKGFQLKYHRNNREGEF